MEKFELHILLDACKKCLVQDNIVCTDHYLCICNEVIKLFSALGLGAAFKESEKSVKTLEIRRVTGAGDFYRKLHLLTKHEQEVSDTSGTKAFVVLHRSMTFALQFLQALRNAVVENGKFQVKKRLQTYKKTLAVHQSSLTQSSVKLALVGLPGRRGLLASIQDYCHGEMSSAQAVDQITQRLQLVHSAVDIVLNEGRSQSTSLGQNQSTNNFVEINNGDVLRSEE